MSHKKVSSLLAGAALVLALLLLVVLPGCGSKAVPSISISTTSLPDGDVGVAYSQTPGVTGSTTPYASWSITSGALPAGLSLNSTTGAITGTPTTAGTNNFTIQVTDIVGGTATANLSITIN